MWLPVWLLFCVLATVACTKSEPVVESPACCSHEGHASAHAHDKTAAATTGTSAEESAEAVSLADVKVVGEASAQGVQVKIQNRGKGNVSLRSQLHVIGGDGTTALPANAQGPVLRWSCEQAVTTCVTLAPGAEYLPPPWPGKSGKGTCGECANCVDVAPGSYVLVAKACDKDVEARSDAFVIGPHP
jgi:hypothetical protein